MKKIGFFLAALALLCVACNQPQEIEETTNPNVSEPKMVKLELKVTIAQETKAAMNDKTLTFTENDIITVLGTKDGTTQPYPLAVSSVDGGVITFSTEIPEGTEIGDYAYYPQDLIVPDGSTTMDPLKILWPNRYFTSTGGVLIPMMAKIDLEQTTVFKHLGSMLKVNLVNVPAGNEWLEFKTSQNFVGTYSVNPVDWSITLIPSDSNSNSEVLQATADGVYYIPIPSGSYADFKLGMMSSDKLGFPAYYNKQRTANLANPITPSRTQIVNLGDFTNDVDEIAEWWHVSQMNGWTEKSRYIKTGTNTYMIIAFNPENNQWWRLEDKSGGCWITPNDITAWNGTLSLATGDNYTFNRQGAINKTFYVTLTKSGDNWVYSSDNWNDNAAEWFTADRVELRGDFNNWSENDIVLTKWHSDYWSNYSYQYEGLEIRDNEEHEFKFYCYKHNIPQPVNWCGGNVYLTDSAPYAKANWNSGDNMKLRLTPGTYNVYINVADWNQGMIFMFVKQPNPQQ